MRGLSRKVVRPRKVVTRTDSSPYTLALKLLARREHSRAELRLKLLARRHKPDDVEEALDKLAAEGSQSDERFAEAYVESRRRKFGERKIAAELRERGVAGATVAAAMDGGGERERAIEQLAKKFPEASTDRKEYARRWRFLASRGFSSDAIRAALDARSAAAADL